MVQGGFCLRFNKEALTGGFIAGKMRGKEFQGNRAFEYGILGFIDDPHSTFTEFLEDFIM